jgi:hypothetical protein
VSSLRPGSGQRHDQHLARLPRQRPGLGAHRYGLRARRAFCRRTLRRFDQERPLAAAAIESRPPPARTQFCRTCVRPSRRGVADASDGPSSGRAVVRPLRQRLPRGRLLDRGQRGTARGRACRLPAAPPSSASTATSRSAARRPRRRRGCSAPGLACSRRGAAPGAASSSWRSGGAEGTASFVLLGGSRRMRETNRRQPRSTGDHPPGGSRRLAPCICVSTSTCSTFSSTRTGPGADRPLGSRGRTLRRVGKVSPANCRWLLQW